MRSRASQGVMVAVAALIGLSHCNQMGGLGSSSDPINFYFTPFGDTGMIAEKMGPLLSFLEKETGYSIRLAVPANNLDLVQGFEDGTVHVALMNSFGYLLAHDRHGAELRLAILRRGSKTYQGMIVTHVDSGIHGLEDLQGRDFAFTERSSGSGYLMARKLLLDHDIEIGSELFVMRHDSVVEMVYAQQVSAGASYYDPPGDNGQLHDARALISDQYPDVGEKVKIIAFTDPLPNGGFVFNKSLPTDVTEKIAAAIQTYLNTPEGKVFFTENYNIDDIAPGSDQDYSALRDALKALNINPADLVKAN